MGLRSKKSFTLTALAIVWAVAWSVAVFYVQNRLGTLMPASVKNSELSWSLQQVEIGSQHLVAMLYDTALEGSVPFAERAQHLSEATNSLHSRMALFEGGIHKQYITKREVIQPIQEIKRLMLENDVILREPTPEYADRYAALAREVEGHLRAFRQPARRLIFSDRRRAFEVRSELHKLYSHIFIGSLMVMLTTFFAFRQLIIMFQNARALAEENLLMARRAEAERKRKSDFLTTASHEIRTPLSGLSGMLTKLQESGLRPEQEHSFRIAQSAVASLSAVTSQLLDSTQIEEGKLQVRPTTIALEKLIEDCFAVVAPDAWSKKLDMSYYIAPDAPYQIECEVDRIQQVIINLLGNAVKYTERLGGVNLYACINKTNLCIDVTDTGKGIEEGDEELIFNPYGRSRGGERAIGTGLGLPISRNIAVALGGSLNYIKSQEHGSIFRFEVPVKSVQLHNPNPNPLGGKTIDVLLLDSQNFSLHEPYLTALGANLNPVREIGSLKGASDAIVVIGGASAIPSVRLLRDNFPRTPLLLVHSGGPFFPEAEEIRAQGILIDTMPIGSNATRILATAARLPARTKHRSLAKKEEPKSKRLSGMRILVLEDQLVILAILADYFGAAGADTKFATGGGEALEFAQTEKFDVILLDQHTPGMSGDQVAKRIRAAGPNQNTRIIAVTADVTGPTQSVLMAAGVDHVERKPIERGRLIEVISGYAPEDVQHLPVVPEENEARNYELELLGRAELMQLRMQMLAAIGKRSIKEASTSMHKIAGTAGFLSLDSVASKAQVIYTKISENADDWEDECFKFADQLNQALLEEAE